MARVVDAITRKEIEDLASIAGMKPGALRTSVLNIHAQHIEKPDPLRIHMFAIMIHAQGLIENGLDGISSL